ncbi:MAG: class II glutamine amidotransferase [Reyranella sp.]|nr:class II glutamine amidotransferase [Reyranella sp.]
MCELFCLSSRLPTRVTFSLRKFADRGGLGGGNVDGWGVAFHDGREVRLYKEPEPAGDSPWLAFIQERRLPTRLLISHIRHATRGSLSLTNTQPFARELGGRTHLFAHNGRLEGIDVPFAASAKRFQPLGDTDSEMAFCLLLERLSPLWDGGGVPTLAARLAAVTGFAAEMRSLGPANFLYSDGAVVFGHGHRRTQADGTIAPPGLWLLQRACAVDAEATAPSGVTIESGAGPQEIALLASVPVTAEQWRPLDEGEIVVVADGQVLPASLPSSRSQT